jgi:hypothetical protein
MSHFYTAPSRTRGPSFRSTREERRHPGPSASQIHPELCIVRGGNVLGSNKNSIARRVSRSWECMPSPVDRDQGACLSPIPHRQHAAGKRKIRRQLEESVIVLSFVPVYAADMDHNRSAGTFAIGLVALAIFDLLSEYPGRTWPAPDGFDEKNWMIKSPLLDPRISSLAGARFQCVPLFILDTARRGIRWSSTGRVVKFWASRQPAAGGRLGTCASAGRLGSTCSNSAAQSRRQENRLGERA